MSRKELNTVMYCNNTPGKFSIKKTLTLVILFIFVGSVWQYAAAQSIDTTKEKAAIKTLVTNYENAWNRHDSKGLADQYDSNATWVNWFGAYYIGKEDIRQHYEAVHTTYFKTSQYYTRAIEDISFVKPDVAIAHVRTGLSGDARFPGQVFEFRRTIVVIKNGRVWKILTGQNAKLSEGIK